MIYALRQDIYEKGVGDAYPVVSHIFYGKSENEAKGYYDAHMTTDQFMRDCTKRGRWEQVECKAINEPIARVPSPVTGATCISAAQRAWHVSGELAAVTLVVPFMAYLATRKQLPAWARVGAAGVGLFSLIVDGYLLTRFLNR
jgi:hypothetical protein